MVFGVLKDIKEGENRVICTPIEVASIVAAGHPVLSKRGQDILLKLIAQDKDLPIREIVDTVNKELGF